jgi:acetyltransferase
MLDGLFRPRGIGVIGASANPFSIGHIVLKNLVDYGYKGPIFPINPKGGHVRSFKAYKSILEVPDTVDLVNISVAAKYIPDIIEDCGQKGVKFAIVHSAGFKEIGEEGLARERKMVEIAHKHGMRIYGPNCQGVQNSDPEISAYANFTFVPMKPGNISIIAQGGGMGELLKLHLHNVGLGHRLYASYGNECDLTMPEMLEYFGQDEGTRVIMMQTESFKDPAAFLEAASRITPHKPILAMKCGRTAEGSVAVSSHTGSLIDQNAMTKAMYKKAGVVEFTDSDEMIKAAIALSTQDPPEGNRIGLITNTGGPGIQAVDTAISSGLSLATWSDSGKDRLVKELYAEASTGNPVDVVATAGPDHYFAAMDTLLKESETDMVMVFFVTAPFVDLDAIATRIEEAAGSSTKPVVVVIETIAKWGPLIDRIRAAGVPVFEFPEDGVRSLAAMRNYAVLRDRDQGPAAELKVDTAAAKAILGKHEGRDAYIPQVDAFELLSAYGVPVPAITTVNDAGDLAAAARSVGFPCVLKVDSTQVVHKSDEGGVVLGLGKLNELETAFAAMQKKFVGVNASFVVQAQAPTGRELIIGASEAPGLGSLVMFGLGGIFVEVLKDVAFSVAPLSLPETREMMREIKGFPLLEGTRGEAGVDLAAIEDMLLRVSKLAADHPCIVEMDLNPVFARPDGATAVDVRIRVR